MRVLPFALLAICALHAADPFFFYAENSGQDAEGVKYRLYGVPKGTRVYLKSNAIHLRDTYGPGTSFRFATGEPQAYQSLVRWAGIFNYFQGAPSDWRRGIPAHRRVQYTAIAPGVDAVFGGADGAPTLTFVLAPSGATDSIFLESDSFQRTSLNAELGTWTISGIPTWTFQKPRAWQQIRGASVAVDVRFRSVSTVRVGVTAGNFDRSQPLYIEVAIPIAARPPDTMINVRDKAGNSYGPIDTFSDRVCTVNPASGQNFCPDAAAAGIRVDGTPIFFSDLAGSFDNLASRLSLDRNGNIVFIGRTGSADFPVTRDAHQPVHAGPVGAFPRLMQSFGGDLFVSILDPKSGDLIYSSFFGGPETENIQRFADGPDSSIAVLLSAGKSLPLTPGAWLTEGGSAVAVFDPSLKRFRFVTFIPAAFSAAAVKFGPDNSVTLTGNSGVGSPTTKDALQTSYGGGDRDGYAVRLSPDGTRALFATYFGGTSNESLRSVAFGATGDLWIDGVSQSLPAGSTGHFLLHLSADGSRLAGPTISIPEQSVLDLRVVPSGDVAVLARIPSMAAFTTADALLRGGCDQSAMPQYFQLYRPDASVRLATYLVPDDNRGIDELYAAYQQPRLPGPPKLICATGAADRRSNGRVSPGQIVTLLGSDLGPLTGTATAPGPNGRYPTAVANLRVLADGVPLPLLYGQSGQINAIMPYGLQSGMRTQLTVEYEGKQSAPLTLDVIPGEFQLFTMDASGTGPAVALNQDGQLNSQRNPAEAGSIVVVYGTGIGITTPAGDDGALAPIGPLSALPRPIAFLTISVQGIPLTPGDILYAGAAPGLVNGLTQVNFRIPPAAVGQATSVVYPRFSLGNRPLTNVAASIWVRGIAP